MTNGASQTALGLIRRNSISGHCLRSLSVVSEARRGKAPARARCVRALSIQRLEGCRPAADAGPMQIQWWEGAASSCAEAVLQSATRDSMSRDAGCLRKRIGKCVVAGFEKEL